jgi:ATP-binding cassette subfamily B protein
VQDFSAREVGQFGAPSLITRTTNDVQQVQMLVLLTFTLMVSAPIMCVGGVVLACARTCRSPPMLLVIVPILIITVGLIITRMRPLFRKMQVRIDRGQPGDAEQITGIRVIRAFVRDDREQARYTAQTTISPTSRCGPASSWR